jgi:DNA-binding PadR family transcriptional regulator
MLSEKLLKKRSEEALTSIKKFALKCLKNGEEIYLYKLRTLIFEEYPDLFSSYSKKYVFNLIQMVAEDLEKEGLIEFKWEKGKGAIPKKLWVLKRSKT